MNMPFPSREQVESIRKNYPPGTRVMLNNMDDPYSPVESGTRGTVRYVDDCGQLGVAWDNGRSLSLIPGAQRMPSFLNASIAAKANTPNARVKSTLCVPSAPFSKYQGTSLTTANPSSSRKYFIRFRVYRKPSAMRKANTGKAMRPKQRMTS